MSKEEELEINFNRFKVGRGRNKRKLMGISQDDLLSDSPDLDIKVFLHDVEHIFP